MGIGIIPLIVVAIIAGDFGQRVVGQRSDYPADDCLDYCADEYPVSEIHYQYQIQRTMLFDGSKREAIHRSTFQNVRVRELACSLSQNRENYA